MTARPMTETCPKLREAIENGHLRCSVSVGVGSPVATIDTEDLWRLVHAAERSLSTSAAERGMREALPNIAELARRMAELAVTGAAQPDIGARVRAGSRVFALSILIENGNFEAIRAALSGIEGEDEQARGQGSATKCSQCGRLIGVLEERTESVRFGLLCVKCDSRKDLRPLSQARGQGRSAPISTDTKGTSK